MKKVLVRHVDQKDCVVRKVLVDLDVVDWLAEQLDMNVLDTKVKFDQLISIHIINYTMDVYVSQITLKLLLDLQNEGRGCFGHACGWKAGPCDAVCGTDGICCRFGFKECGCDGTMGAAGEGHICVEKKPEPEKNDNVGLDIQNEGKECMTECGINWWEGGQCDWCGKDGMCCRKGKKGPTGMENACDGCLGDSVSAHVCVKKPWYF